jgi:alkaline phosphatase D
LIETTGADGVILLSGNVHFAEISRHNGPPYPLVEFTSSGMTHVDEVYAKATNSYRVSGPYVDLNVGFVEIDWAAQPSPLVALKAVGMDGSVRFEHRLSLSALRTTD